MRNYTLQGSRPPERRAAAQEGLVLPLLAHFCCTNSALESQQKSTVTVSIICKFKEEFYEEKQN